MNILKTNTKINTHFLIYEDFPYVEDFTKSGLSDLKTYLEKKENMKFKEVPIELNKVELSEKINTFYKYKSQIKAFISLGDNLGVLAQKFYQERCETLLPAPYACEITYKTL